jgi:hypothetical protein
MNNTRRGLPLARARIEQIFPKLTPTQIRRITPHGRTRTTKRGEVLYEQGDSAASFFVVVQQISYSNSGGFQNEYIYIG